VSAAHYENFPVASLVLPRRLRAPVLAIYDFARTADDVADEGDATAAERLAGLDCIGRVLDRAVAGRPAPDDPFPGLAATIHRYALPPEPFRDLLSAFRQDVTTPRYPAYADLLDYCRRSANPIGRLLLHLYGAASTANLACSDAICTGLQLVNFWQDVEIDFRKDRIYLPQDEMMRFGVGEHDIAARDAGPAWQNLLAFQTDRARAMLESGAPLAATLPGRIGLELGMIVQGGLRILEKLDAARGDMFRHRPVLRPADWALLFWRAVRR